MTNQIKNGVRFTLEQEREAFGEIHSLLVDRWKEDITYYRRLTIENEKIDAKLKSNNIQLAQPPSILKGDSLDPAYLELIWTIFDELVFAEPILYRLSAHNFTLPQDLHVRKWLIDPFLPRQELEFYTRLLLYIDLFKGSALARGMVVKGKSLEGIPVRWFVVGKILRNLMSDFRHYRLIDQVKMSGAEESIEDLRESRVYDSDEGVVYDYSPLFKEIHSGDRFIIEIFNEEEFKKFTTGNWATRDVDTILCSFSRQDPREDFCYGDNTDTARYEYIVRYDKQEEVVPMQLLPKYKPLVEKTAKALKAFPTDIEEAGGPLKKREDKLQEGRWGLLRGLRTWNQNKGPASNWLADNIRWQPTHALEKLSTTKVEPPCDENCREKRKDMGKLPCEFETPRGYCMDTSRKRRLFSSVESSGGSLDMPIDKEDEESETRKESIESNVLTPEEKVIFKEDVIFDENFVKKICQYEPRMKRIIEKKERGETLTDNERQIWRRTIKVFKEKYQEE